MIPGSACRAGGVVAQTFNTKPVSIVECTDAIEVETVFTYYMFVTRIS
jgi:hypothetical protein